MKTLKFVASLFLILFSISTAMESTFEQEIMSLVPMPEKNGGTIIRLFKNHTKLFMVQTDGIASFNNNKWNKSDIAGHWLSAAQIEGEQFILGGIGEIALVYGSHAKTIKLPGTVADTVRSIHAVSSDEIWVGTNNGLLYYDGRWKSIDEISNCSVNGIVHRDDGQIWVAASNGLYQQINGEWRNLDDLAMAPGLGPQYLSLSTGGTPAGLVFTTPTTIGCLSDDGNHWVHSKGNGLPYGPVNGVVLAHGELWGLTKHGVVNYRKNEWHYYAGKRWVADNDIIDILPLDEKTTWIATPAGISEIKRVDMTFAEKTDYFEQRIALRHKRHGQVAGSRLLKAGDLASNSMFTNDNDGLWTAIYLAAESFRYAVTQSPEAYQNAINAFLAMERLETLTPISGFPARSIAKANEDIGTHGEWHFTADGQWKWKGDTSSDEIVGHLFAYPIFYDLVAKGEYKTRARDLVDRIMTHIVDNNFLLVDLDGKPTRWGVWCPDSLNKRDDWLYEKGINSLQILSFLESAYHMTGKEKYQTACQTLITEHGYADNMMQQKMFHPYEINHSDDELAFLPYYCLLRYANDPQLMKKYRQSMARSWKIEIPEKNPLWNIIASTALGKPCNIPDAVETLQLIPMDMILWNMDNSHRWDYQLNPIPDRFGRAQSLQVYPPDERAVTKWNSNPYRLDQGGSGHGEDDGAYFLLPYWMGRYHGYIKHDN